jgi:hypothetical protein
VETIQPLAYDDGPLGYQLDAPLSVFICYRRRDTQWAAASIREELSRELGSHNVFMDVSSIQPGHDFVEAIDAAIRRSSLVLALIGPRWLEPEGADGRPRIADPADHVRVELETALALKSRIVPILVDGASMPVAGRLPASLNRLARRQAITVGPADFGEVIRKMVRAIRDAA